MLQIQLMCFDIAVTKMQTESKQRDSEDPGESDTHRHGKRKKGRGGPVRKQRDNWMD